MLSWPVLGACYANIWDSRDQTMELKSITLEGSEGSEITVQQSPFALDTIDTSKIQFTSLELKDFESTGVLTLRTSSWKWKLN